MLRIVDALFSPADPLVSTCTGAAPTAGTPLRQVNLCDLLGRDLARTPDKPARYELVSALYADIRPTWSSGGATLCAGDEAVLVVHKFPEGSASPRECVQLRCASSFPPQPASVGKNGEYCRSEVGSFEGWTLSPGRVEARYDYGVAVWSLTMAGARYDFIRR